MDYVANSVFCLVSYFVYVQVLASSKLHEVNGLNQDAHFKRL